MALAFDPQPPPGGPPLGELPMDPPPPYVPRVPIDPNRRGLVYEHPNPWRGDIPQPLTASYPLRGRVSLCSESYKSFAEQILLPIASGFQVLALCAIFVFCYLALKGVFPTEALCPTIIALSGTMCLLGFSVAIAHPKALCLLLMPTIILILGSLGLAGVATIKQVAYGCIGTSLPVTGPIIIALALLLLLLIGLAKSEPRYY